MLNKEFELLQTGSGWEAAQREHREVFIDAMKLGKEDIWLASGTGTFFGLSY
jgi:hypothetical protein